MKKITAVIATEAESMSAFESKPIFKSLQRHYDTRDLFSQNKFEFVIVKGNKEGLSSLYNKYIEDPKYTKDILLFVHDDVELEDMFLIEKLQNSPYDVTGLAGTKKADMSLPPAWHLMSKKEDWVGEVAHASTASDKKEVWTTVFGPTNSRALLIDGLFIAVNVESVKEKQVKFDENFKFHHYDLSFCIQCNKAKLKIGVLPIRVVHHGLGDSMLTDEWKESANIFKQIYGTN
jgi:GT2 family glycosyltransferase